MLAEQAEVLGANSATNVATGADASVLPKNTVANGRLIVADPANTGTVYLLLGTGVASASNWNVALAAGSSWAGLVTGVLYTGPVRSFSAAAQKIAVTEV